MLHTSHRCRTHLIIFSVHIFLTIEFYFSITNIRSNHILGKILIKMIIIAVKRKINTIVLIKKNKLILPLDFSLKYPFKFAPTVCIKDRLLSMFSFVVFNNFESSSIFEERESAEVFSADAKSVKSEYNSS